MSDAERLANFNKRLREQQNDFVQEDKDWAYAIWMVEKEFNVGPITEEFLVMKFINLIDEENCGRYAEATKTGGKGGGSAPKTLR